MPAAPEILCIGSVLWDVIGRTPAHPGVGGDVAGRITRIPGGVAMNIAMTLARLGLRPALLTAIGRDAEGDDLLARAQALGLDTAHVYRSAGLPTDIYMAIECGERGLVAALADAHSLEAAGEAVLAPLREGPLGSAEAPYPGTIAVDGNLTTDLLGLIARDPAFAAADLRVAPASPGKAARMSALIGHARTTVYVNLGEARTITGEDAADSAAAARALVAGGFARAMVSDGPRPAALADKRTTITAVPPPVAVQRVTGAGDTLMAAHIAAELEGRSGQQALGEALAVTAAYISKHGD